MNKVSPRLAEALNSRLLEQFIKWSIVGTIGAVVDYGVLIPLVEFVRLDPRWAQAISFTAAASNNYIWNRLWTFRAFRHKPPVLQFTQFFVVSVVGLAIRTAIFVLLYQGLAFQAFRFGYILATAIAIIVVLVWNFFVNRLWTFREVT